MKERNLSRGKGSLNSISIFISLLAIGVVIGGLFFNSMNTCSGKSQYTVDQNSGKIYFSPPKLPDTLDFAGEPVPLHNFDVKEALDREMMVNSYFHSQTLLFIKKAPRYFHIIEPILKEQGVPDDFKYLALAESGFFDRAESPVGAVGIWQFMKPTAREYGLEITNEIDERYNLVKATQAACKYLKHNYEKYGSWTMVAAAYNAGRNGVARQIVRQKNHNYYDLLLGEETGRYVYRILALKLILSHPERFGFKVPENEIYPIIPTYDVTIDGPVNDFADFAKEHGVNYKILKYFNPWLRETTLSNPSGKTYIIRLPEKGYRTFRYDEEVEKAAQDSITDQDE